MAGDLIQREEFESGSIECDICLQGWRYWRLCSGCRIFWARSRRTWMRLDPNGSVARVTTAASANPVLPPKWAFGVLFASYRNQADVLDAVQRLRKDYCGDLLWIDSSWLWGAYDRADRYICFEFDTNQFSDAKGMISTLHENHFHFGVWEWPYIDQSITNLFQQGESNHFFITDQRGGTGKVVNGGGLAWGEIYGAD